MPILAMDLLQHAEDEMRRAGLYDEGSDYGGMIPAAVMGLVRPFAAEGHSGGSAALTLEIFNRVVRFRTLSSLTNDPAEWTEVSEYCPEEQRPLFQNKRDPRFFSQDGGKTGYCVDDEARKAVTFQAKEG